MAWIYLAGSVASLSRWLPGSDPSPIVKQTPTAKPYCCLEWPMAVCPRRLSGMTCAHSGATWSQGGGVTSFTAASPARTSALLAMERAWKASALGFSLRSRASFAIFDLLSSSWRTCQPSLFEGWIKSPESWPRAGMTVGGTCYELATWERTTRESAGGSWPTPTARDWKGPGLSRSRKALANSRRMLPLSVVFKERFGYRLPASFVEYLMGYAPLHTVCAPWAMQWFRSARAKPSKDSAG